MHAPSLSWLGCTCKAEEIHKIPPRHAAYIHKQQRRAMQARS